MAGAARHYFRDLWSLRVLRIPSRRPARARSIRPSQSFFRERGGGGGGGRLRCAGWYAEC